MVNDSMYWMYYVYVSGVHPYQIHHVVIALRLLFHMLAVQSHVSYDIIRLKHIICNKTGYVATVQWKVEYCKLNKGNVVFLLFHASHWWFIDQH